MTHPIYVDYKCAVVFDFCKMSRMSFASSVARCCFFPLFLNSFLFATCIFHVYCFSARLIVLLQHTGRKYLAFW